MARKPPALARELLRNFPKRRRAGGRSSGRRRRKGQRPGDSARRPKTDVAAETAVNTEARTSEGKIVDRAADPPVPDGKVADMAVKTGGSDRKVADTAVKAGSDRKVADSEVGSGASEGKVDLPRVKRRKRAVAKRDE